MEHMCLVVRVFHFETIASGLDIFIRGDLVTSNVDISFDLGLLKLELASTREKTGGVGPYRVLVTTHPVEIVSLQYTIPVLPRIIVFPLLHQPAIEIGRSNLLEDAATLHEAGGSHGRRWRNR